MDLNEFLDVLPSTELVVKRRSKAKLRIRVGSKRYYQWMEWCAGRAPKAVPKKPLPIKISGVMCDICGGTGIYRNAKYTRPCNRCVKGYIDQVKANANALYDAHRAAGTRSATWEDYSNPDWGYAA